MNHWLKILEAFKAGKFPQYYYGLTPRFIIGACQIPIGKVFETKELAFETTKKIFDEMRLFNSGGLIVVSIMCGIHNGPVMTLSEQGLYGGNLTTTFDEIWIRYGEDITNGNYQIDPSERKIIEEIYNG